MRVGVGSRCRPRLRAPSPSCHWHLSLFRVQSGTLSVLNVSLAARSYPFTRLGSFQSSDAQLTEMWLRAVNTLETVTDDAYGSDARERNEWLQVRSGVVAHVLPPQPCESVASLCRTPRSLISSQLEWLLQALQSQAGIALSCSAIPALSATCFGMQPCRRYGRRIIVSRCL